MIRRNPTLLPMNDNDVQSIRDIVDREKVDPTGEQKLAAKMQRMADNPSLTAEDYQMLENMKKWKEREELERNMKPAETSGSATGARFSS
ncbi:hypothetical protein D9757_000746 [Collybiopsis confluens]|uniref:Uncharacterized protein n=1 Tax=Collybiopsis confluens TaxID=2823264 RepID=A0A8H5I1D5_9AGAR|nr:hypothetical protein D9757_000746 [Collybiopsis confluens]